MLAIEVERLVKNFGKVRAVDEVSFRVNVGEIFGLIGPNGAGKTTILRIISTLLGASSGSVKVFDNSVSREPNEVRSLISYLPEEAGAYDNLSGRNYLEFISRFFSEKEEIGSFVKRGIEIADLGERIEDKAGTYSKGMTRRLLVARTLMTNPKLAILDEPTSGLDVTNAQEVREIIKNSSKKETTVLLSSHNMFEVDYLCERIAMISQGRIVEQGAPSHLKRKHNAKNLEEVFSKVIP